MRVIIFLTVILSFAVFVQIGCKKKGKAAGTLKVVEKSVKQSDKLSGELTESDSSGESLSSNNSNKFTKATELSAKQIARKSLPAVVLITGEFGDSIIEGSGFFVLSGVVVSNYHVVEGIRDEKLNVTFQNSSGKMIIASARVIAYDIASDLALIDVPAAKEANVAILPLAPENAPVEVGETIYALGNPKGLTGTFSQGIISAELKSFDKSARLQITAPISEGSSGGPILNSKAEVIGAAVSSLDEGQNLNFAVPHFLIYSIIKSVSLQSEQTTKNELSIQHKNEEYPK